MVKMDQTGHIAPACSTRAQASVLLCARAVFVSPSRSAVSDRVFHQSSEQPVPAGPSQCRKKKQPSSRNGASRQEAPSLATNIQSNDVAPHAQWVDPATFSQQDGLLSVPSQSSWSSRSSSPQSSVGPSPGSPVDTFGMCMPVKVAADDTLLDFANEIFSQTNDVTWMLDYMKRVANSGVNMLEFAELLQAMQMCVGSNSAPL